MDKKVTIITLTYNNCKKATEPFLESLYKYTDESLFDLIVVENGSTDETKDILNQWQQKKSNIKIIYNEENKGYSIGNNQGIKIAKTPYVALLNNDILLAPNWIEDLLLIYEKEQNVGLVSPTIINTYTRPNVNTKNYIKKIEKLKKKPLKKTYHKVFDGIFSCVIIPKNVIEKVGLMDTKYTPAWFEDNDYSFRTIMAGFYNYISDNVYIYHNHCTTSSKIKNADEILERNKKYYFSKHYLAEYIWNINLENYKLKRKLYFCKKNLIIKILYGLEKLKYKIFYGNKF